MRYLIFSLTFILTFFWINSKNEVSDKSFNTFLNYFKRTLEIENMPRNDLNALHSINKGKRRHKKAMAHIKHTYHKNLKSELQKYKFKYKLLKEISIDNKKGEINIKGFDPEEAIVELTFFFLENKKQNETHLLKSKFFKESAYKFKSDLKNCSPKNLKRVLNKICGMALELQRRDELDPNIVLAYLIQNNSLSEIKEHISKKEPDLNHKLEGGWSPLLLSVANGCYDKANYLLQKGADPNISNELGATPLGFAAHYGNLSMCELLISFGAKVNKVDLNGSTALMRATMGGHGSVVNYLLDQGADSSIQDFANMKALDYAIKSRSGEIAKMLRKSEQQKK
jgi:hypothetical protein